MRWRRLRADSDRMLTSSPYRVLVSIGAEWIRALVVELERDATAIVGAAREKRRLRRPSDAEECISDLCERAVSEAEDSTELTLGYRVVADFGLLAVPNTWSLMADGTITQQRRDPERRMDATEVRAALDRAVAFVLSQQAEDTSADKMEVIYAAVTEARVDGHRVTDPLGFRGQALTLGVFLSLMGRKRSQYLRDIGHDLELDPVRLIPLLQALVVCLPASEAVGILLDDDHTDVFRVLDRRVVASRRVPQGAQHILLGVTDALGIPTADARRLQRAHRRGLLNPVEAARVEKELLKQMWSWAMDLRPTVSGVADDTVPPRIYVCGAGGGTDSLRATLDCPEWYQGLRFARHPQISCFGPDNVAPLLDRTGGRSAVDDLALRCLAVYARLEAQAPSRVDAVLTDVLRDRGYIHAE